MTPPVRRQLYSYLFGCALSFAQSAPSPTFEVASVKLSPPVTPGARAFFGPPRGGPGTPDPGLLAERFGVKLHHEPKEFQVQELVVGKNATKLKETAVDPGEELEPGPPKFKDGELSGPGFVTTIMPNGQAHTEAKAQTLSRLTTMLGGQLHRPVLDKPG